MCCRWQNVQGSMQQYRQQLAAALEIHIFNRDVDDINDRINEKVALFITCLDRS